jgi:hypothetical protein
MLVQLLLDFHGETTHALVIKIKRQPGRFMRLALCNFLELAIDIALVLRVYLNLLCSLIIAQAWTHSWQRHECLVVDSRPAEQILRCVFPFERSTEDTFDLRLR